MGLHPLPPGLSQHSVNKPAAWATGFSGLSLHLSPCHPLGLWPHCPLFSPNKAQFLQKLPGQPQLTPALSFRQTFRAPQCKTADGPHVS